MRRLDLICPSEPQKKTISATWERHCKQPEISADDYVRQLMITLAKSIEPRRTLYLDTRYWIHLRDAALGRPRLQAHVDLLEALRNAVRRGKAVCPLNDATLLELTKQADQTTRRATARLIDELSLGTALITEQTRVATEVANFMLRDGGGLAVHPMDHLVWVRTPFVLGAMLPRFPTLDPATELVLQKVSVDRLWEISLEDFVVFNADRDTPPLTFNQTAETLNDANRRYAHEIRSFEQAFLAEIGGGLYVFKEHLADVVIHMAKKQGGIKQDPNAAEREHAEKQLHTAFTNLFRFARTQAAQSMPTLYIHAKCHATVRWDRNRKLTGNDLLDFHHATGAIAYCDAFFTDRSLKALLTTKHVRLDREFDCFVASDEADVLKYLATIA